MCRAEQRAASSLPDECEDNDEDSNGGQPQRRRKPPQESRRRMAWRTVWVILNNLYSIPAYILVMWILMPIRHYFPRIYWFMEGHLCKWMYSLVASWLWSAGYTVTEMGDDTSICQDSETLVMVNHQSTGDVPILMNFLLGQGNAAYRTMWILDKMFKFTQFGLVSQVRGDFFIGQGREGRQRVLENLRKHLKTRYTDTGKKWIIVFPEGGFLYKRRLPSQEYARKFGYPYLEHATLPRIGAVQTILQTLLPKLVNNGSPVNTADKEESVPSNESTASSKTRFRSLKYVIDTTIAYPSGKPLNLLSIGMGTRAPCTTTIHNRIFLASELPQDTEGLTKWMYDRYTEKDKMLEYFYKTGKFCSPDMIPEETDEEIIAEGNSGVIDGNKDTRNTTELQPSTWLERPIGINSFYLLCVHVFFLALTWYISKNIFFFCCWLLG